MKRKNAFTLVELLVVLTIGSTLMALAVEMVHQAMLIADSAQESSQQAFIVNRFFQQFRSDVHSAKAVESVSSQSLSLALEDKSKVVYTIEMDRVVRTQNDWANKVSREVMMLNNRSHGSFHFEEAGDVIKLCIFRDVGLRGVLPRLERCVEANLSRISSIKITEESRP